MAALLAFDTSTERVHVGVARDDRVWLAETAGGAQASANLMPSIASVLGDAGISLNALDAIAFGRGPGAFTGLRAACSAAQGLAWGAKLPVLAIDTLMAVAEDARTRAGASDVWVAMDARMGEIYCGRYRWSGAAWETLAAPSLVAPRQLESLFESLPAASIAGSAAAEVGESLRCARGTAIVTAAQPAARALLACARSAWERGEAIDAAAALPLYLRDKVALTSAERSAAAHRAGGEAAALHPPAGR